MKLIQGSILVNVDLRQKEEINGLKSGKKYNENFRERNPVIAFVEQGSKEVPTGSYIVCNYSYFDLESPLQITDSLYSIPINEEIFATINSDGSLNPIMGNVLVERVTKETKIELPPELKKPHTNRGVAISGEYSGKYIFWLPYADYEIVYTWEGKEHRALKIHQSEITGYLK